MKVKSMVVLLILAGIIGIVAALWSGSGAGLGPVRMGDGQMSSDTRGTIMVMTLIGGVGALLTGFLIKVFGRRILGIASLVFGAFMIPSLFQANVLSIVSVLILGIVGITLLSRPISGGTESPGTG